jgi:hypothetical protein
MLKRARTKWLDRRIAAPGPYLCLCLSEPEFKAAVAHLKAPADLQWVSNPQSDATAHTFESPGGLTVVVCLRRAEGRNPVEVAGLLVHEAVHAWQAYAEHIGERNPGIEQEAYAIQSIAQELMAEFARRMGATC